MPVSNSTAVNLAATTLSSDLTATGPAPTPKALEEPALPPRLDPVAPTLAAAVLRTQIVPPEAARTHADSLNAVLPSSEQVSPANNADLARLQRREVFEDRMTRAVEKLGAVAGQSELHTKVHQFAQDVAWLCAQCSHLDPLPERVVGWADKVERGTAIAIDMQYLQYLTMQVVREFDFSLLQNHESGKSVAESAERLQAMDRRVNPSGGDHIGFCMRSAAGKLYEIGTHEPAENVTKWRGGLSGQPPLPAPQIDLLACIRAVRCWNIFASHQSGETPFMRDWSEPYKSGINPAFDVQHLTPGEILRLSGPGPKPEWDWRDGFQGEVESAVANLLAEQARARLEQVQIQTGLPRDVVGIITAYERDTPQTALQP